jgi:thiamine biosynthesis lipoprotein
MRQAGASAGVLDLGGNLLVFGAHPGTEIGVVDPNRPDRLLATLPVVDAAVATSGQYERFLEIDGRRFGHILDPRSGRPVPAGLSVTVIARRAILADALATAAVVLGAEAGRILLEETPQVEGILVVTDESGRHRLMSTTGYEGLPPAR